MRKLLRTARLHRASNGPFLLAAVSAACSKSVISRLMRRSRDFTTLSAPTMARPGRCAFRCHSCSQTNNSYMFDLCLLPLEKWTSKDFALVPCVHGSELARAFFTFTRPAQPCVRPLDAVPNSAALVPAMIQPPTRCTKSLLWLPVAPWSR
jgi:hypothetical protein